VAAGHRSLQFNLNAGPRAGTALGKDVRVRLALDKAIDRRALSGAVPEGLSVPNNQAEVPGSPFWDPDHPVPGRDLEGAKALLREAGVEHPSFTLDFLDTPPDRRIAEAIRAMAGEAGFDIKLEPLEGRAANDKLFAGDFATALLSLPGQADPDGNLASMTCAGPFNFGGYCNPNMEELLKLGRETADPDRRIAIYRKAAGLYLLDMPEIILGNTGWVWGVSERVEGFVPNRDGLIRPQGLRLRAQ